MKKYEEETGKYAIWRGIITEGFKNWFKGDKVYNRDKERISLYVNDDTKKKWQKFIETSKYKTFSKLIRDSVESYIKKSSGNIFNGAISQRTISNVSHALKEPLTSIKGYSQLLLDDTSFPLSKNIVSIIRSIYNQSLLLENKIINIVDNIDKLNNNYDVLLVEDDISTVRLVTSYLDNKGLKSKGVISASTCLEELKNNFPKFILLDIVLPDRSGYDLCKEIKSNPDFVDVPIYFITAIPGSEVELHLEESRADGYILKPFDLSDFQFIIDELINK